MSTPETGTAAIHQDLPDGLLPASVRSGLLSMRVLVPADPGRVWQHLTRPTLLATWSPVHPDRALDAVGPARSQDTTGDAPVDLSVLEVIDGFRLVHRWGAEELIWQLAPNAADTQLQLVVRLQDADAHAAAAASWHVRLRRLQAVLGGHPGVDAPEPDEEMLRARYAEAIVVNNADN